MRLYTVREKNLQFKSTQLYRKGLGRGSDGGHYSRRIQVQFTSACDSSSRRWIQYIWAVWTFAHTFPNTCIIKINLQKVTTESNSGVAPLHYLNRFSVKSSEYAKTHLVWSVLWQKVHLVKAEVVLSSLRSRLYHITSTPV